MGISRQQAIELKKIEAELKDEGVTIIDVFLQDTIEDVEEFFRSLDQPIPDRVLMGDGELRRVYQVYAIPRVLLVDRNGRIVFDRVFAPGEEILAALEEGLQP